MSHQPPVPSGNQSPYPLHEAPHKHDGTPPAGAAVAKTPDRSPDPKPTSVTSHLPTLSNGVIGALAAVGFAAIAAAGAWALTQRPTTPKRKNKKRAKR